MGYNIILNDIKAFREGLCQVRIIQTLVVSHHTPLPQGPNLRSHPSPSRLHPGRSYRRLLLLRFSSHRGTVAHTSANVSIDDFDNVG